MSSDDFKNKAFETRAVHAGSVTEDNTGAVTTPIYPSSTYTVAYPGDESGYVYSRSDNPTRAALERALATIESAECGLAFASGLAATATVMNLLGPGDHVVANSDLYGGIHRQFENVIRKRGIDFSYVDGRDAQNFEKATNDNTKLYWLESPSNPLLHLTDIEAVSRIAKKHDIRTVVDNTFATPYLQQPLALGADICLHSASKYLGGHCDIIGGALMTNDKATGEELKYHQNASGCMLGPFESWLVLRGIKTLAVRMEKHSSNALAVVEYLKTESIVSRILFPGIDGAPLPNRMKTAGGMVSFDIDADAETVSKFAQSTKVFILAESLGGVESLLNHPARMTHASIPEEIRLKNGITDGLVRLSVGIESSKDQIDDLKAAFAAIK